MKFVAVMTHHERTDVGLVDEIGEERGHPRQTISPYRRDPFPDLDALKAVVVLGGPQSAYADYPYLREEERFLARAVESNVPVLAICLGAQLLARALGGSAEAGNTGLEAGIIQVKPEGTTSERIAGEFFSFHSDTMTPPADAEVIAVSDRYVQAWTLGSALGVQFHPEMTIKGVGATLNGERSKLERFHVDAKVVRAEAERYYAAGAWDSRELLEKWFDRLAPADLAARTFCEREL